MVCINRKKCKTRLPTEMIHFLNVLIERNKLQLLSIIIHMEYLFLISLPLNPDWS